MKHMSNGFMGSIPESTLRYSLNNTEVVQSVERNPENDTSQLTTATHAGPSEDSSASSATPPSVSGNSTPIPHKGPPNTSTGYDKTCCPTHWWKPSHYPKCETTSPSRGTIEVPPDAGESHERTRYHPNPNNPQHG